MVRQLDVEVCDAVDGDLMDGCVVDQIFHRDQDVIGEHSVIRREPEVARWSAWRECIGFDAHWPNAFGVRVAGAVDGAVIDCDNWRGAAALSRYAVADTKVLNGDVAIRGRDARAFGEACGVERKLYGRGCPDQAGTLHRRGQAEVDRGSLQHRGDLRRCQRGIGLQHQRRDRRCVGSGGGSSGERRKARADGRTDVIGSGEINLVR